MGMLIHFCNKGDSKLIKAFIQGKKHIYLKNEALACLGGVELFSDLFHDIMEQRLKSLSIGICLKEGKDTRVACKYRISNFAISLPKPSSISGDGHMAVRLQVGRDGRA